MKKSVLQHSYGIPSGTSVPRDTTVDCLRQAWRLQRKNIRLRLNEFSVLWRRGSEENLFAEIAFCLFTPQSKALNCWAAVKRLHAQDLLLKGSAARIAAELKGVRFHNTKAARLVMARQQFMQNGRLSVRQALTAKPTVYETRDWLVENVLGLGYKEASHFLRNVGLYRQIAILDRHILRNLQAFGVIKEVPGSLPQKTYCAIEQKMKCFARGIGIPPSHLDLLLWCRETGEIFK